MVYNWAANCGTIKVLLASKRTVLCYAPPKSWNHWEGVILKLILCEIILCQKNFWFFFKFFGMLVINTNGREMQQKYKHNKKLTYGKKISWLGQLFDSHQNFFSQTWGHFQILARGPTHPLTHGGLSF